jgi:hypothetical protein
VAIDPGLIGPTTLAISQAVGSFTTFLPSLAEIRKNDPVHNPEFTADVRVGEVAAVAVTMGVGVIVSSLTGSNAPAFVALIACLGLIVIYESTLRADRPMEAKA